MSCPWVSQNSMILIYLCHYFIYWMQLSFYHLFNHGMTFYMSATSRTISCSIASTMLRNMAPSGAFHKPPRLIFSSNINISLSPCICFAPIYSINAFVLGICESEFKYWVNYAKVANQRRSKKRSATRASFNIERKKKSVPQNPGIMIFKASVRGFFEVSSKWRSTWERITMMLYEQHSRSLLRFLVSLKL